MHTVLLSICALGFLTIAAAAQAATFNVDNVADDGDANLGDGICQTAAGVCTVRAALQEARLAPGPNTITFDLAGPCPCTIQPGSALPSIDVESVILDATTQPGWAGAPIVEFDGSLASGAGLTILAGDSTVRGLVINRFPGDGITLATNGGNLIEGNYIGTDVTGSVALGNGVEGIHIFGSSSDNQIGGTTAAAGNVISGNVSEGIQAGGTGQVIQGNYIGTDASGTSALANGQNGILLLGAHDSLVGGTDPGAGNVVSGNAGGGIQIRAAATNNRVQGNHIGVDASGILGVGNGGSGIHLSEGASSNTIGGTEMGARNVISSNGLWGVLIASAVSTANAVQGNYIGTDASGTAALGNVRDGILSGGSANTFGGSQPGAGNIVSGNGRSGVDLRGSNLVVQGNLIGVALGGFSPLGNGSRGILVFSGDHSDIRDNTIAFNGLSGVQVSNGLSHTLLGNSIHSNAELGIDLIPSLGVTLNDPQDPDAGANGLQNFPELTSVTAIGAQATLDSTPTTSFTLEFFSSATCDPSSFGEGESVLGSATAATDPFGFASVSTTFASAAPVGHVVTATATDAAGNTSEFSECVLVEGIEVEIDIKPGSDPNSINLGSHGTVPVAILSSPNFDATEVDPATVSLASATVKLRGRGTPMASQDDVNGDGLLDLVVHVETEAFQLSASDEEAVLEGQTFGGVNVTGSDSVRIVP